MKVNQLCALTALLLSLIPKINFSQAPDLGTAANYVFFSTIGAVSNAGVSDITGDVGANDGALTGFGSVDGQVDSVNSASAQCSADLLSAYNELDNTIATFFPAVLLGNGQVLNAGVYSIAAATTLTSDLTFDAQGDSNAVFIIKIQGAFSTAASSIIYLVNEAEACSVFWKVEGAVSMAAGTTMRGTVIANNAAISMAAGGTLEGRALSTTGAVSVDAVLAYNSCDLFILLPIELMSFTGDCEKQNVVLKWGTATEINNDYYSIERGLDGTNWNTIGTINSMGNSSALTNYSFTDEESYNDDSYYRLKQTDLDGQFEYSNVITVANCIEDLTELYIYPNPAIGTFNLFYNGDKEQVHSVSIYNALGEKVYHCGSYQSVIDLSGKQGGIYFLHFNSSSKINIKKLVIEK